ncbi:hypothetical protein BGZ63DRAFT_51564 [Mariannaea sp. PMI_226]|nr:hypothetical protein BGZ63DRAFT_51564 [Mariannaea sp. PMI_226]
MTQVKPIQAHSSLSSSPHQTLQLDCYIYLDAGPFPSLAHLTAQVLFSERKLFPSEMTTFSPYPAYILGAACCGRGLMAILQPRSEYGHVGLLLEPKHPAVTDDAPTPSRVDGASNGSVSPLMYFKGIRELSYGATMMALQWQGFENALMTFAAILSLVRFGDGLVVWLYGGKELKWRAMGHWITGAGFVGWVAWRWR